MLSRRLTQLAQLWVQQNVVSCTQHVYAVKTMTSSAAAFQAQTQADVAIVGGGMVGAALASLLASNSMTKTMRIVLIDNQPQSFDWKAPEYPELRVSTITPASIAALQRPGAWPQVSQNSAAFTTMQVWDTAGPGCIRWHAHEAGRENMGIVAENSLLQAALLAALKANLSGGSAGDAQISVVSDLSTVTALEPGVTCLWPASLEALQLPPTMQQGRAAGFNNVPATLQFKGGASMSARLVVAADGAASRVRSLAGFRTWGWDYRQRGVVATVQLQDPGCLSTAWQRFLPTGPLALLPVRDGLANIVWSTTPEAAAQLEHMAPKDFAEAVNRALTVDPQAASTAAAGQQHGTTSLPFLSTLPSPSQGVAKIMSGVASASSRLAQPADAYQAPPHVWGWLGGRPRSFPLRLQQSGRYVRPRLALIGDAAHAVHPLAGQGVNLGFGDAVALADALIHACEVGSDPGDLLILQDRYERQRQRAVMSMTAALDGLQKVFGVQALPFAAARNLGLGLLNAAGPVKNNIMKYAMGL